MARKKAKTSRKSVRSGSVGGALKIDASIWPTERDIMMRPERLKYVRKVIRPAGCVFCEAARKGVGFKPLVLYKGPHAMVIMNKYPYNNGHLLVLPVRHCGEIWALTDSEFNAVNELVRHCVLALQRSYEPQGYNVGLNHGSAAGAGIPEHIHYHVIPRWRGDTNFFPLIAETKVVVETLEETYQRLLPYFLDLDRKSSKSRRRTKVSVEAV